MSCFRYTCVIYMFCFLWSVGEEVDDGVESLIQKYLKEIEELR